MLQWKPKHTAESVASELAHSLREGAASLDNELNEFVQAGSRDLHSNPYIGTSPPAPKSLHGYRRESHRR